MSWFSCEICGGRLLLEVSFQGIFTYRRLGGIIDAGDPQSENQFRFRFVFVSCVRTSGRGEAVFACERGAFVNAVPQNGEMSSSGRGCCLCLFAAVCICFCVFIQIDATCTFCFCVAMCMRFLKILADRPPFVDVFVVFVCF